MSINKKYCNYCFNARVACDEELTDENDFSSSTIGYCDRGYRFMLTSGSGKPLRIELEVYGFASNMWFTFGNYYPKYCPECGRKLNEYGDK